MLNNALAHASNFWRWFGDTVTRPGPVRDALRWAVPALIAGLIVRAMFLSFSPYAFWAADSQSYLMLPYRLFHGGEWVFREKRRWLYPILLIPAYGLPGSPLKWLAVWQHAFGLAAVLPLAYVVRRWFVAWKLWVVPITVLYVLCPMLLGYEHVVLAEFLLPALVIWTLAGWTLWIKRAEEGRCHLSAWWWMWVPLLLLILSKPQSRFFWPGLLIGLLFASFWKKLTKWQWASLALILAITLTVGKSSQGVRLAYSTLFSLTRLDTPLLADYKAEIRDLVEEARANLHRYYYADDKYKDFLQYPHEYPDTQAKRPLWFELGPKEEEDKQKIYKPLAMEALKSEPHLFLYIALQRVIGATSEGYDDGGFFEADFYAKAFQDRLGKFTEKRPKMLYDLFDWNKERELPDHAEFSEIVSPHPDSTAALALQKMSLVYDWVARMTGPRGASGQGQEIHVFRPRVMGVLVLLGVTIGLCSPRWRELAGAWGLVALGYMVGVYLVGSAYPRFYAAAVPVIFVLAAVPLDMLVQFASARLNRRSE